MDPVRNPYSPGAGRRPAALVGRDAQLAEWDVALERVTAGRTAQPIVLYGLRGVGKTVLLAEFARRAKDRGWVVARLEARADRCCARSWATPSAGRWPTWLGLPPASGCGEL